MPPKRPRSPPSNDLPNYTVTIPPTSTLTSSSFPTPPAGQPPPPTLPSSTQTQFTTSSGTPFVNPPAPLPVAATLPPTRKRPLQRPPVPKKHEIKDGGGVVYVSSSTPWASAVKRVEGYFQEMEEVGVGGGSGGRGKKRRKKWDKKEVEVKGGGEKEGKGNGRGANGSPGVVRIKATGRAIDRALQVATRYMDKRYRVRIMTGTMWTVDDVVEGAAPRERKKKGKGRDRGDMEMKGMVDDESEGDDEEVEEVEAVERRLGWIEIEVRKPEA